MEEGSIERDDELYKNLFNIINLFNNRPNHLTKYLIDNNLLSNSFIKKITRNSEKISEMNEENIPYFTDLSQVEDFYNSIIDDSQPVVKSKLILSKELNEKLDKSIKLEKYEDSIRIRDYMKKHKIKRIN